MATVAACSSALAAGALPKRVSEPHRTPLVDALKQCAQQNVAAFHFPGHVRGASAPDALHNLMGDLAFRCDLPELPELDNLHAPEGAIASAQREAATLFGADSTWFLVNGSTCGIQAAVMSTCKPGDYLVLPRNCHISAFSAMVLSGALPSYVQPVYDETWAIAHGVSVQAIEAEILRHEGNVGAVLVVSPTYFGVCSPVKEIAELCHKHGIPLIVDEAHGAHFRFHDRLPLTALEQGADIAVQSTHKVLCSLTQSAMLHVQGALVNHEMISKCLRTLQTSSPSYLLMASLDAARAQMSSLLASGNHALFDKALGLSLEARQALKEIPGIVLLDSETMQAAGFHLDILRITVGLWKLGLSGVEADDYLRESHNVVAELPSFNSLTFAVGTGNSRRDIRCLVDSLKALEGAVLSRPESQQQAMMIGTRGWTQNSPVLSPREAFFSNVKRLNSEDAVGLVSAELVCPYPPGIPLLFPGEVISGETLDYLKLARGLKLAISGASDSSLVTLLVCDPE